MADQWTESVSLAMRTLQFSLRVIIDGGKAISSFVVRGNNVDQLPAYTDIALMRRVRCIFARKLVRRLQPNSHADLDAI